MEDWGQGRHVRIEMTDDSAIREMIFFILRPVGKKIGE